MKTRILFLWGILMGCSACNRDLFIDRLSPSVDGVSVQSDGSTMRIDLGTGDWNIGSVYTEEGSVHGDIYNLDGQLVVGNAPLCGEGLVRLVSRHPMIDLVIERPHAEELLLTVKENPGAEAVPLSIVVGNQYEAREIHLQIEPSEAYQVDSVVYVLDSYQLKDSLSYAQGDETLVVRNAHSSETLQWEWYPFQNASSFVKFTCWAKETLDIFGKEPPLVHVPVPSSAGRMELSDEKLGLSSEYTAVPVAGHLKPVSEPVTVPPFESVKLTVKLWYEWKGIRCTLYATHPRTGRKRVLNGLLERVDPCGYTLHRTVMKE